MPMLPIKHQSIFKSRWIALLWAGGIIWSAVEFTGSLPGANPDNNQVSMDGSEGGNTDAAAASALSDTINSLQGLNR